MPHDFLNGIFEFCKHQSFVASLIHHFLKFRIFKVQLKFLECGHQVDLYKKTTLNNQEIEMIFFLFIKGAMRNLISCDG